MSRKYHPLFWVWENMKRRCLDANRLDFKHYGGRGIKVCERWLLSGGAGFKNFVSDMGERPPGSTLERIDNNGDYSPKNCCWSDRLAQSMNRRGVTIVTINGKSLCLSEWAKIVGLDKTTIYRRIKNGMTPEQAINCPSRYSKNKDAIIKTLEEK